MELDDLISRSEVTGMLFAFADVNAKVGRIVELLADEDGPEEEAPQDDP